MNDAPQTADPKARRLGRSPAYPSFSVQKALEQVKALYAQEKEYAAPLASALKAWGYGAKSSGGRQTLATMKYYGLVDITGEGDSRRIKVSDVALKILRDPREDDTEKRQTIRRVALTPSAHKLLLDEYPSGLASDGSVQYFLLESGFNEQAARELLAEFKDTASHIGLYEPHNFLDKPSEEDDSAEVDLDPPPPAQVGDKIQWTLNGVDQFAGGAVVEVVHPSGEWVWVSEKLTKTGIPMQDVQVLERGGGGREAPARPAGVGRSIAEEEDQGVPVLGKPKITLDDDILTIKATVKMSDLGALKKKIEAMEAFYNAQ